MRRPRWHLSWLRPNRQGSESPSQDRILPASIQKSGFVACDVRFARVRGRVVQARSYRQRWVRRKCHDLHHVHQSTDSVSVLHSNFDADIRGYFPYGITGQFSETGTRRSVSRKTLVRAIIRRSHQCAFSGSHFRKGHSRTQRTIGGGIRGVSILWICIGKIATE